jgi:hypothetical protein
VIEASPIRNENKSRKSVMAQIESVLLMRFPFVLKVVELQTRRGPSPIAELQDNRANYLK